MALEVKNLPANEEDIGEMSSIPGPRRSPGRGHDNVLQYSCLENPMDRRAWQATAHCVSKRQTLRFIIIDIFPNFFFLSVSLNYFQLQFWKVNKLEKYVNNCGVGEDP